MRLLIRRILLLLVVLTAAGLVWFVYYGGRYLQHEDALQKSDVIFVLAGARAERLLEGYHLYMEGYAPLILLSPGRVEPSEAMLRARGINFPSEHELAREVLLQLGVPPTAIQSPAPSVDNTAQEANLLRARVQAHGWKRVIVVTAKFHTRRSGFAFRRALEGTGATVVMRASRFDPADPANWWRRRSDFRFASSEWQKLILYRLGLGG
jgi:uncharacterized SAM-binding protein YcdF (DUF218 family)